MGRALVSSRYTFRLTLPQGEALFNANTGAVLRLAGPDARRLAERLSGPPTAIPGRELGTTLRRRLARGGFLLDPGVDELAAIRERYWQARRQGPIVLLVTTTMDCNLGCYYCYESRSSHALRVMDVAQVVALARDRLQRHGKQSLHVDWYGGEPLMNVDFLEAASRALQEACRVDGIAYSASVISNGTEWPDDVEAFVRRHAIRQVQISFDGLRERHDRTRHYRPGYRSAGAASSFDRAAGLVDGLLYVTRVDVRYNADPGNAADFGAFLDFVEARGWLDAPFPCVVLVAKVAAYSQRSLFMRRRELGSDEFAALEAIARDRLPSRAQDDLDVVAGFPHPKTSVCGALAFDSTVIGADGLEYRCGLQVGERHRAVGRLMGPVSAGERFPDREWWETFDPTTLPTCSRCSFLPVCWGGCPKRHLEASRPDIDAEGRFWRANLPRMIAAGFGEPPPPGFAYTSADQFRD